MSDTRKEFKEQNADPLGSSASTGSATKADKRATQLFELNHILIKHCGKTLTPDNIDIIKADISNAITDGPCAWAFE